VIADVSGVQDVFVRAEADGLRQVLVNLLVNAVHAIEAKAKGGSPVPERRVSLSTRERTPGTCEISVADTGCGIPRANIESIFVPFFTTKCSDEGTGLGLAIVQRSLTAWGGGVEVESVEGQGTVFHLRIPMAAPRD
jgi:signal transduction histidine kinase